ncbi:MAG: SMI1/KNR4 family protein [Sandaracinaceae bacterium]
MRDSLPAGFELPRAIGALCDWIEDRGLLLPSEGGRVGVLYPEADLRAGWTATRRPGGTRIGLVARGPEPSAASLHGRTDLANRLSFFAETGGDGSQAAFWLDDEGTQHIVHLGSGSGSMMACVLANSDIDFLRLLAIGYDEICWSDELDRPPNAAGELHVEPNEPFREWVCTTFGVDIPTLGVEIIPNVAEYGDDSPDPFCRWLNAVWELS